MTESTCYDEAGAMMAATGKGVFLAVGKNPTHPSFADRLVALNLREPQATIEVHAAWRRDESSRTILNFIQTARTQLQGVTRVLDMRDFPHIVRPGAARAIQRRKRR